MARSLARSGRGWRSTPTPTPRLRIGIADAFADAHGVGIGRLVDPGVLGRLVLAGRRRAPWAGPSRAAGRARRARRGACARAGSASRSRASRADPRSGARTARWSASPGRRSITSSEPRNILPSSLQLEQHVAGVGVLLDHLDALVDDEEPDRRGPHLLARIGERLLRARGREPGAERDDEEASEEPAHRPDRRRAPRWAPVSGRRARSGRPDSACWWLAADLRAVRRSANETHGDASPSAPIPTYQTPGAGAARSRSARAWCVERACPSSSTAGPR